MTIDTEVLVCGGGLAGIGAAVAAARAGAKVLLVERSEILGGLGAGGGVGGFAAARGGHVGQGRVFADILAGLRAYGALGEEHGWPVRPNPEWGCENWLFDHQVLPLVLQEICLDAGVRLRFATTAVGVDRDGDAIDRVRLHGRSLGESVAARVVVDATGDGIVARLAGAEVLPDDPGFPGVIQPSFMIFLRRVDTPRPQPVPSARLYADRATPDYSVWREEHGRVGLKLKLFDTPFDTGDAEGYNACTMAMRTRIPEVVRHFQETQDAHYVFDYASPLLGIREGRRITGDHVLTIDELRAGARFPDAVAYGTFTVDANRTREILPPYQIPYGSLVATGLENCFVPGRCFSADRMALSSARVMPTCCLMGNAVGLAAAEAVGTGRPVRSVDTAVVREALARDDPEADHLREHLPADTLP
ncbi:MAG: FAD-dependent oxidoreductase [Planctomycetota bacterium]